MHADTADMNNGTPEIPSIKEVLRDAEKQQHSILTTRNPWLTPAMVEGSISKTQDERTAIKVVMQEGHQVLGYGFLPNILLTDASPMEVRKRLMVMMVPIVLFPSGMETENRKDALRIRSLPLNFANYSPPQVRKAKTEVTEEESNDPYAE
jgi:hypothetical protein